MITLSSCIEPDLIRAPRALGSSIFKLLDSQDRICPNQFVGSKKILSVKLEKQDFINFLISVELCAHTAVKTFPFISWNVKRKSKWFSLLPGLSFHVTSITSSLKVVNL